jgi:hypothetical protein
MKMKLTPKEICKGCPYEFQEFLEYSKGLSFEEEPDYDFISNLFLSLARAEGIDLLDNMYDWNVRATAIQHYPHVFDFIRNQKAHPLDKRGRLLVSEEHSRDLKKLYAKAIRFQFLDTK